MFDDTSMLDVVGQRHPLVSDIVRPPMPAGSTVAEIVRAIDLDTARYGLPIVLLIRGAEMSVVPVDMWRKTRVKAGTRVEVAFAIHDPGSLALIASAALPQAATWLAGSVLGMTGLAYSLTVAAITIVGSLAINALIPPAQQSGGGGPQNYAITGVANAENRYGVYPTVIGRHRMYPPKTATGYSETIGKDIYYRGRMTFGHGPVALEDLRIGTTPIWEFDGIELEFLNVDRDLTLAAMPELAALVKSRMEETQRPKARLRELGDAYTFTPAAAARTASLEISVTAQRDIASLDLVLEASEVGSDTWSEVQSWAAVSSDISWASGDLGTDGIRRRWRLRVTGVTLQAEAGTSQFALLTGRADAATVTNAKATYQAEAAGWRHGAETMRLYPNDVAEDPDNALPDQDDPVVRYTRDESISASVDISFTNGLYDSNDGDTHAHEARFRFSWQPVAGGINEAEWVDAGSETYRAKSTTLIRFTKDISFPESGAYAIRIERLNQIDDDTGDQNAGYVTAIRSVRDGALPSHDGIAELAFRIKATDQLNGQVDSLNAIVQQLAPVLDGNLQWTEPRPVRHPAWGFLQAIRGRHLRRPVRDERIDLAAFYAWAAEEPHWTCDYVVDSATQVGEVLDIIAAAGRAKRTLTDFRWSVIRDGAAGPVRQVFTPRNSWGYSAKLTFPREIHGFRVQARSERLEWQEDEILVLMDGFTRDTATELETLPLPGVVVTADDEDEGNVYRLGRYHLAVALNRPERHSFYADFEHIRVTRGDKIRLVHDVPLIGVGAARIKAISDDGAGNVAAILLDDLFDFDQDTFRFSVRNVAGERIFGAISPADPATRSWQPNAPVAVGDIAVGDLVAIEEVTQASAEMLIVGIYPDSDESARIEVVDAVPAVLDAATGTIPAYSPVVTQPRDPASDLPPAPAVISAYSNSLTQLVLPDLSVRPRIAVQLAPFASTATTEGMTLQLRWREDEEGAAWAYGERVDAGEYSLLTGALEEGLPYLGQVRSVGPDGKTRGWVDWPAAVTASTAPPAPPLISATVSAASVPDASGAGRRPAISLSWTPPANKALRVTWQLRVAATGELVQRGLFAEASEGSVRIADGILPATAYQIRASLVTGAADQRRWSAWFDVTTPDLRISAADLGDDLAGQIATAFDRHDEVLGDATGTVGALRDSILASFAGVPSFEALDVYLQQTPLITVIETALGPLSAPVSLSAQIDMERDRLDLVLPRIYDMEDSTDDIWQRLIDLREGLFATETMIRDAGVYVSPEDGTVRIVAVEHLEGRYSDVQINLDAVEAELSARATVAYVNQTVANAVLDPTQIPLIDDLSARISTAEITLDAVEGTVTTLADTLTVEGGLVTMTTVTQTLDSLQGQISDRVTYIEFNTTEARLTAAEQTISSFPDEAAITSAVEASRVLSEDLDDALQRSIIETWERFSGDDAIRVADAQGRADLRAYINERDEAIVEDVTQLRSAVGTSVAQIEQTLETRASDAEAAAEAITQLQVDLTATGGTVAAQADALDDLTTRVSETEGGLEAEAERQTVLTASVRDIGDDQEDLAELGIVELWERHRGQEDLRAGIAVAGEQMRSWVEEGLEAEASQRLVLGAALADAEASIVEERTVRATHDAALAQDIAQLTADLSDAEAGVSGNADAITEVSTRVTNAEGTITAQASEINNLEATLSVASGAISANGAAISGIDTRVTSVEGSITSQSNEITQLQSGLAAAEGDIVANGDALSGLTTRVTSAEGTITSQGQAITALETDLTSAEGTISSTASALSTLDSRVTNAEGTITSQASDIVTLQSGLSAAEEDIAGNGAAIAGVDTRVTSAEGAITSQGQAITSLENDLTTAEGNIAATATGLSNLSTRVTDAEGDISSISQSLITLQADVSDVANGVDANEFALASLDTRVTNAEGTITSQASEITQLQSELTAAQNDLTGQASAISNLDSRVTSAEGTITSQASEITQLQSGLSSAETGVAGNASAIAGIDTRVKDTETGLTAQASSLSGLEASVGSVEARVTTIEGAYVTSTEAVTAVEQEISASFGSLTAMASATAFANAQAGGIEAGYVWRLNDQNVMEMVSVADGTTGATVTYRLAADYVQITGLTQIDQAVINSLAVDNGFITNLTVDTLNIASGAINVGHLDTGSFSASGLAVFGGGLESDDFVSGVSGWRITTAGDAEFNSLITRDSIVDGAVSNGARARLYADGAQVSDETIIWEELGIGEYAPEILYTLMLRADLRYATASGEVGGEKNTYLKTQVRTDGVTWHTLLNWDAESSWQRRSLFDPIQLLDETDILQAGTLDMRLLLQTEDNAEPVQNNIRNLLIDVRAIVR
ncbi:TipJ family phage tail tip protein [Salipiger abyssi]|uniref:TipJ family phage tail tip protein n=1 Tax=Salipiger abyssi TaxID=1250539 RepID=UPI004058F6BA